MQRNNWGIYEKKKTKYSYFLKSDFFKQEDGSSMKIEENGLK